MPERLHHLEHLSASLGDAVSVDDVARAALSELLRAPSVLRGGLALSRGAGRELSFVSSDEESLSLLGVRWCPIDGLADVPLAHTIRTATSEYLRTIDEIETEYPDLGGRQRRIGTRSIASVPMLVDGACVGALMVSFGEPQEFDETQTAFLDAFAAQVSQAMRRALAYQAERSTSEELQRSLMPHSLPELPGLALGAHYQAGGVNVDVGGDWYDVMPLADGTVVMVLGDVMGKGVSAAIVMSEVRSATRAYALLDPDPPVVLERLDAMVSSLPFVDQVVTMLYAVVEPAQGCVRLAVAGHPPPLLVTPSGRPVLLDGETGPALGFGAGPWRAMRVPLEEKSILLLYSDGLVETRSRDLFTGIDLLCDVVERLPGRRRNPRELCARLTDLMGTTHAEDDVTLLAVTASQPHPTETRELPADSMAAAIARRFVVAVLSEWRVDPEVIDTAELCTSELVTNAIIHSGTTSTLTLRNDGEFVMVMVHDRGAGGAVHQPADLGPDAISGRGLSLVDALASAWSAEHNTDGTTVWFELELRPVTSRAASAGR